VFPREVEQAHLIFLLAFLLPLERDETLDAKRTPSDWHQPSGEKRSIPIAIGKICLPAEATAQVGFHAHANTPPRIWLRPPCMGYLT